MHDMVPRKPKTIEPSRGKPTIDCHGFNGQEKDDEIYGEGSACNFSFRMYDARLGRFWSVDPLTRDIPWNSPYAFHEKLAQYRVEHGAMDDATQGEEEKEIIDAINKN